MKDNESNAVIGVGVVVTMIFLGGWAIASNFSKITNALPLSPFTGVTSGVVMTPSGGAPPVVNNNGTKTVTMTDRAFSKEELKLNDKEQ